VQRPEVLSAPVIRDAEKAPAHTSARGLDAVDTEESAGLATAPVTETAGAAETLETSATLSSEPTVEDLIKATRDPIWKVRWDAVNALGNLKDPRGIPALVERAVSDDNPHPRWRSLWALKAIDREGLNTIPLLHPGLQSSDAIEVRNAAVALAFFAQPEGRSELLEGLSDADSFRRWEASFILREIGNAEVAQALLLLLDETVEPEKRVRGQAVLTFGTIGGNEAVSALLDVLQDDSSPQVRWRAALALSRLGDASLVERLEQAVTAEKNPQVRESIDEAIEKLLQP